MRLTTNQRKLSVLSMAIAATVSANAARGATLTLYYDNIQDLTDGQSYSYATTAGNYAAIPTTINIAVGDTLQFGIDAVVTNNVNPDAGKITGSPGHVIAQPSFLGLSTFSIVVPSSDTTAARLLPDTSGAPFATFAGAPDFNSTASLNNFNGTGSAFAPNNNPSGFIPHWSNSLEGDVAPTSATGGDVGDHFAIFQGNGSTPSQTQTGANTIAQYGAPTATFGNATDFFDSLSYTALSPGVVLLSPAVDAKGTSYWANTSSGSSTVPSGYIASTFTNPGDTIGTLPELVIHIGAVPVTESIISLAPAANGPPNGYGSSQGALTVSGHNGDYSVAQLTGLNAAIGYVEVSGFNPGTDEEIYALDISVNGIQANAAQIEVLVNDINLGDFGLEPATGIVAADTYASLGVTHDSNPFPGEYNLFLDSAAGPSSDNFLGFNVSNSADSNLVGYSVSAIAVVPEPMSLGLLILGGAGLLNCRRRKSSC
jgi:hypothetical protein